MYMGGAHCTKLFQIVPDLFKLQSHDSFWAHESRCSAKWYTVCYEFGQHIWDEAHIIKSGSINISDISYGLPALAPDNDVTYMYSNLIVMLERFHLASNYSCFKNYLKQECWDCPCWFGTANNIFGHTITSWGHGQGKHIIIWRLLSDKAWLNTRLQGNFWPFGSTCEQNSERLTACRGCHLHRWFGIQSIYDEKYKTSSAHVPWRTYMKMIDISVRLTVKQILTVANIILRYNIAAGHHNCNCKKWNPSTTLNHIPTIISWRVTSPKIRFPTDVILEQTYNFRFVGKDEIALRKAQLYYQRFPVSLMMNLDQSGYSHSLSAAASRRW